MESSKVAMEMEKAVEMCARYAMELVEDAKEIAKTMGTTVNDALDSLRYAHIAMHKATQRQQANNWRRMHGLPMRRKRGKRDGRTARDHGAR